MEKCQLSQRVLRCRRVGTPIIYIETGDPLAAVSKLEINDGLKQIPIDKKDPKKQCPVILWDIDNGPVPKNNEGKPLMSHLAGPQPQGPAPAPGGMGQTLLSFLKKVESVNVPSVIFAIVTTSETMNQAPTIQKIYNLREKLKPKGVTLVLLGGPINLPHLLKDSVTYLKHEKPNQEELRGVVEANYRSAKGLNEICPDVSDDDLNRAALGLRGLGSFAAETSVAMALDKDGINFPLLQENRYTMIERPGLKVWKGQEKFKDIVGLDGVCQAAYEIATSPKLNIGAIVYVDEIEKALGGSGGGDISGMSDRHLGQLLKWLEDNKVAMMLFIGHPGCGKTEVSKAIGNETKLTTLQLEIEMTKGSLMGESEHNMDEALATIDSVSGKKPLVIASCNEADRLPSALMRRVRFGSYFFDLPSGPIKEKIWKVKMDKYDIPQQDLPNDDQWAGHEIEVCVYKTWVNGRSLIENAQTIIPVGKLRQQEIASLKTKAEANYLSAVTGLPYYQGESYEIEKSVRRISLN